ncbi:hypothetical protein DPW03_09255 [Aggregatibacter aphrophilus]|nr:hypothetical protein DPW03_09255 [Aggregatibacter aphrophilus]RDE96759.1 hypothetical protein DPW02_07795 [Aggregatibacter aphrophilus]
MRRIIFGCILTLCYTAVFAQMKTDLALLNLKGPVKKWEMKSINPKDSSILEHKITFFNPQGFKIKEKNLGDVVLTQNFVYDEKGRLIKSFIEGDNNAIEYLYRTNSDGSLTVIHKYKAKGMPDRIISENTYDKNGLLIIEKTEDESCEEGCEKLENGMNKYSHHYDEHGNILETRNEIFGGEPFKYVNKYVDGKLVEQTQFAYGGREVTTFDTNGNKIQFEDFPPYGFGDGSVSSVKIWKNTLDNHGNVVRIEEFDNRNNPSSTIIENSYEYY